MERINSLARIFLLVLSAVVMLAGLDLLAGNRRLLPQPALTPTPESVLPQVDRVPRKEKRPTPTPSPTPTPHPFPPEVTPPPLSSPDYGMQAFVGWWKPYRSNRDLALFRDAGFTWVKQTFAWRDIEGAAKGHFDWQRADEIVLQAHGRYGPSTSSGQRLEILAQVGFPPDWVRAEGTMTRPPANLQDWADFLYTFASRYQGWIRAYEIWNEPNLAREWGGRPPDAVAYVELLRVAYRAIKEADPRAVVVSAGLAQTGTEPGVSIADDEYLEAMYAAMGGDSDLYLDALGAHAMGFKAPPEVSPAEAATNPEYGGQRFFTFRRVEDLRQIMEAHGDADKQVVVTELGWTSDPRPDSPYHWHAVTEEQKADYLVRAFGWAEAHWQPWIGPIFVFTLADPAWTPQDESYWWAITDPSGEARLALQALEDMPKTGQ